MLLALTSALFLSANPRARAANSMQTLANTRISPEVRQLMLSGNPDTHVKVIVQSVFARWATTDPA